MLKTLMRVLKILYLFDPNMDIWTDTDMIGFRIDPDTVPEKTMHMLNELGVEYNPFYSSLVMYI